MFKSSSFRSLIMISACGTFMTGCAIAPGYTDSEKEITENLSSSNFQPASRATRDNIETQEIFAQAAFWSREYELNPGDLESSIKLAAAVRKLGNPLRAVEIAQTSRALYPRDPYLTAEFAAALIASEQAFEAMKPLDDALRTAPGYARLWSLKGAALDQQEDYELARKHYARAMQITPNDPNIMANIGLSYALSGDPQTAEGWLRRAVSIPGASKSVRQNLSLVLQLQGKEVEATKYSGQPKLRGTTTVGQQPQLRTAPQRAASLRTEQQRTPQQWPSQQQAYQARPSVPSTAYAPQSYSKPNQQAGIPASERGQSYSQNYQQQKPAQTFSGHPSSQSSPSQFPPGQFPQRTLREGTTLAGAAQTIRKSSAMTASDAARLAAQKSTRRKLTVPLGDEPDAQTLAQTSVLEQIARTIGPQASGPIPKRSLQANSQYGAQQAYPQKAAPYAPQNEYQGAYQQQGYQQQGGYQQQAPQKSGYIGREAARSRR